MRVNVWIVYANPALLTNRMKTNHSGKTQNDTSSRNIKAYAQKSIDLEFMVWHRRALRSDAVKTLSETIVQLIEDAEHKEKYATQMTNVKAGFTGVIRQEVTLKGGCHPSSKTPRFLSDANLSPAAELPRSNALTSIHATIRAKVTDHQGTRGFTLSQVLPVTGLDSPIPCGDFVRRNVSWRSGYQHHGVIHVLRQRQNR